MELEDVAITCSNDKILVLFLVQIYQIPRISDLSRSRLISGTRWLRVTRWLKCQVRLAVRDESRIYPIMNRKSLLSNLSVEIPLKIWALQLDFYNWIFFTFNCWLIEMTNWKWLILNGFGDPGYSWKRENHWQFQNYLIWLMLKVQRTEWCFCHLNLTN